MIELAGIAVSAATVKALQEIDAGAGARRGKGRLSAASAGERDPRSRFAAGARKSAARNFCSASPRRSCAPRSRPADRLRPDFVRALAHRADDRSARACPPAPRARNRHGFRLCDGDSLPRSPMRWSRSKDFRRSPSPPGCGFSGSARTNAAVMFAPMDWRSPPKPVPSTVFWCMDRLMKCRQRSPRSAR